jgi:hypothetical protein
MSRILICGSRSFDDYYILSKIVDCLIKNYPNPEIVSGGSIGADRLAERYASEHRLSNRVFKADWDQFGKKAGYLRNCQMHEYIAQAENRLCIAFWDGSSLGTKHNFELVKQYDTNLCIFNQRTKILTYQFTHDDIRREFTCWGILHGNQA